MTSLLYSFIFVKIIPESWLRIAVSLISAFIIEGYAIAVMVLDHQVQQYNGALKEGEPPIRYNAKVAKVNYIILVFLVVLCGHILPELACFPKEIAILSLLPMLLISWYGYEMFSVNYTLRDRLESRVRQEENDRLAQATQAFADRGKNESEAALLHEKRLLEEARAKQEEARAVQAKAQVTIAREERKAAEVKPVVVSPGKSYEAPSNGVNKPWDESSFVDIALRLEAGEEPPEISHLDTWQRYQTLLDKFEFGQQFDINAKELVGVNAVRFRKDLKLLAAHRLVSEVARGVYVLVEGERAGNDVTGRRPASNLTPT